MKRIRILQTCARAFVGERGGSRESGVITCVGFQAMVCRLKRTAIALVQLRPRDGHS